MLRFTERFNRGFNPNECRLSGAGEAGVHLLVDDCDEVLAEADTAEQVVDFIRAVNMLLTGKSLWSILESLIHYWAGVYAELASDLIDDESERGEHNNYMQKTFRQRSISLCMAVARWYMERGDLAEMEGAIRDAYHQLPNEWDSSRWNDELEAERVELQKAVEELQAMVHPAVDHRNRFGTSLGAELAAAGVAVA